MVGGVHAPAVVAGSASSVMIRSVGVHDWAATNPLLRNANIATNGILMVSKGIGASSACSERGGLVVTGPTVVGIRSWAHAAWKDGGGRREEAA